MRVSATLYETILGEEIDKRNFRKRVAELNSIVATDQFDKMSAMASPSALATSISAV